MRAQISYQDWSDFLLRVGAVCTPSELHGLMCGLMCTGAPESNDPWFAVVSEFMDLIEGADVAATRAALEAQQELIGAALSDDHYSLQLLLPDDAVPVADRAEALALWCQGFLHGLGAASDKNADRLNEEAREALVDLAQIANMAPGAEEDQQGEQDLMQLTEYVRLSLFTLASQLRPEAAAAPITSH